MRTILIELQFSGEDEEIYSDICDELIATDMIRDCDYRIVTEERTRDYEVAIERIRAGEDVDTVLNDYGWERK